MLEKLSRNDKIFWIAALILLAFRIFFGRFVGIWFKPRAYHDDALMVRYADFHSHFIQQELPFYDSMLKDMGYPVFLNLVHFSGLQYSDVVSILWFFAALTSVILFRKLTDSDSLKISLAIFAFVLFAPCAFDLWCGTRLYRNNVLAPFYFLNLNALAILFVMHFRNLHLSTKIFLPLQILFGLIFTITYYLKEDGVWLMAVALFVFVLCTLKFFLQSELTLQNKFVHTLILFLPLFIFYGGTVIHKEANLKYFGVYETNTRTAGEGGKFVALIYKIKSENRDWAHWAPADALQKAFEASATLRADKKMQDLFMHSEWFKHDIVANPIHGDFLTWVTNKAISESGYFKTAAESESYFKKINTELEAAFADGTLPREDKIQLVSSVGGRSIEEIFTLKRPMLYIYNMHVFLYHYKPGVTTERLIEGKVEKQAVTLTNTDLYHGKTEEEKESRNRILKILFKIYMGVQGLLFVLALLGIFRGVIDIFRRKLKFSDEKFLILIVAGGFFILSLVYAFAIAWFSQWLGSRSDTMKFYSVGIVPMLMNFEIFGAYFLFKSKR